jgi:hypothetical protein
MDKERRRYLLEGEMNQDVLPSADVQLRVPRGRFDLPEEERRQIVADVDEFRVNWLRDEYPRERIFFGETEEPYQT